ncbi:hypothetical protein KR018_004305 [Drosophila ironensis]|nr:hypothetical protein KR018_004305 [Drosophila ironensis]
MELSRLCARLLKVPLQVGAMSDSIGSRRTLKVTVVGAAGGIGQPLSLLLKLNSHIETLCLHDVRNVPGVAADLSHIATKTEVLHFDGPKKLKAAMDCSDIVVIPAGLPRKPGMNRTDLIDANAGVAADVAIAASEVCPGALLAFITNPVNIIVPIAATILKCKNTYDPRRLFGVTTLDLVRARTFLGQIMKVNPLKVDIPVIGGHTGTTILPILSKCKPELKCDEDERLAVIHRIQEAGTEVVKAKAGLGSATLSMAYSANLFVSSLIRGIVCNGEELVEEYAYVQTEDGPTEFFSTRLALGPQGVKENFGLPDMEDDEKLALKCMLPELKKNIKQGNALGLSLQNRKPK